MPQHKKLSQLPLRINPRRPKTDQEWDEFIAQLQQHFNAIASIDLCSGLTKFSDAQNKGYYLGFTRNDDGYDDGQPVFVVGDRSAEKYVQFDGSDISVGDKTQLLGSDSYSNSAVFYHTFFDSLDGFVTSGTVSYDTVQGALIVGGTNTGLIYRVLGQTFSNLSFTDGNVKFKFQGSSGRGQNAGNYVMVGTRIGADSNGFGFYFAPLDEGGGTYGVTRRSGTDDLVLLEPGVGFGTYEASLTAGSKIEWYFDGEKLGEQADVDKLPQNGSSKASGPQAVLYIEANALNVSPPQVSIGEWMTLYN